MLETFDRLITWAKARKILLVNDNPYSFVLTQKPQSILSRPGAMEVAIELNSLSKSFNMAGWRVGMLSGKAALIHFGPVLSSPAPASPYLAMPQI